MFRFSTNILTLVAALGTKKLYLTSICIGYTEIVAQLNYMCSIPYSYYRTTDRKASNIRNYVQRYCCA